MSRHIVTSGAALDQRRRTPSVRFRKIPEIVRRTAPYHEEPGYSQELQLWLYGNAKLLDGQLAHIRSAAGPPVHLPSVLEAIERETENLVLAGKILVCGIHSPAHQRAAVVPLRWGSPRIVVFSGGFRHHLGPDLADEAFRTARLWRLSWDANTDLAVSRRAPHKLPTYALYNPTIDRLVAWIAEGRP